jgi:hypothetical protein
MIEHFFGHERKTIQRLTKIKTKKNKCKFITNYSADQYLTKIKKQKTNVYLL